MKTTFKVGKKYKNKKTGEVLICLVDGHSWDRTKRLYKHIKNGGTTSLHVSQYKRKDFVEVK